MPPLPTPFIRVDQQLDRVVTALTEWPLNRGGKVAKMENLAHLWEHLQDLTNTASRYLVLWGDEKPRGDYEDRDRTHRVDRTFTVVVVRGKGFRDPDGRQVSFSEVCEDVRDRVRTILDISEEFPVMYLGMRPLPNILPTREANAFADAKLVEFSVANDIPAVVLEPETESALES